MITCYAAYTKSEVRKNCSSGGIYAELANCILDRGGVVYASAYDEDFSVKFKRIVEKEKLSETYGSKYTQSQLGTVFQDVKKDLESGQYVMFCGLPCQVAGVKSYLQSMKTAIEKLYTVDLFCHGEPSAKVWATYVKHNFGNKDLQKVNMRNKDTGWSYYNYSFEYEFEDHTELVNNGKELYMQGYLENLYTKPACFQCQFKEMSNCSDITLGDFWGVDKVHPDMDDNKGTSAVIVHTKAGMDLMGEISNKEFLTMTETTIEHILSFDNGYIRRAKVNPQRHKFLVQCDHVTDVNALIEKNINLSILKRYINKVIKLAKRLSQLIRRGEVCVGCTACANVCRKGAIKMVQDVEGFWYPKVDKAQCVGCGMCVNTCPVNNWKLKRDIGQVKS